MKKNKIDSSIIIFALILVVIIAAVLTSFYFFRFDVLTNHLIKGESIKILFTVSDKDNLLVLELFFYNPKTKKAGIYYIHPNTGLKLKSIDRVDAISVLYKKNHIDDLLKQVELMTDTDIEFYLDIQLDKVGKLTDLLEGIELFISNPVETLNNDKRILIPSGSVILDGDKIIDYLTYDDPNEEPRERIGRKQKFLQGLIKRFGDESISSQLMTNQGFDFFKNIFFTNITPKDLKSFIQEMKGLDTEQIIFQREEGKITEVEGKSLLFPYFDGELVKQTAKQVMEAINSAAGFTEDVLNIRIEILNGTSIAGMARTTANIFEQLGYDVVSIGNADRQDYANTIVLDRKGKSETAEHIAQIIKCRMIKTELNAKIENTLDISIIIGKDFDGRYCKQ